jgi:pentatricopeptide repeat protein
MIGNNIKASLVTFNTLLDLYISQNNYHMANHLFKSLNEKKDPCPDNFTYSIMISGVKSMPKPNIELALEYYTQYNTNFSPDLIILNTTLDVCVTLGAYDKVDAIMESLQAIDSTLKCDEITYNTLIKGCAKRRDLNQAKKYFELMKTLSIKPNKITYNSLMDICSKKKDLNGAMKYLDEMNIKGIVADEFSYSIILNSIKSSKVTKEYYSNTVSKLEGLISSGDIKPDEIFFNSIIDVATQYYDIKKAEYFFNLMKNSAVKPTTITYGILIKAYGKMNNMSSALDMFEQLKASGEKINVIAYGCLLDACVKTGKISMSEEIFKNVLESGIKLNAIIYTTMIKGYSKSSQTK